MGFVPVGPSPNDIVDFGDGPTGWFDFEPFSMFSAARRTLFTVGHPKAKAGELEVDKTLDSVAVWYLSRHGHGAGGWDVRIVSDQGQVVSALALPLVQPSVDIIRPSDFEENLLLATP